MKERIFVGISYLPKATVQASIGGGLMELGYELNNQVIITSGYVVLATSVLAILITAPLGAVLMDRTVKHLITKDISETITVSLIYLCSYDSGLILLTKAFFGI